MPDEPNFDELTEHDVDVVFELVNNPDLDKHVHGLEGAGALAEVAWLESVADDFSTRYRVCEAVAVASAAGKLEHFRISIPGDNSDQS